MKFKRCALLLILLSCLVLSSCGGPEDTYKSAQALLAKGEYAKAGEKFESIGSYEDAATLTMYCKACALCESGDYEAGLKVLATLGGYKDSLYRITYYTARSYEDIAGEDDWECMLEAQNIYETIPVFLDSGERITALDKRIETAKKAQYDAAVRTGESGDFSAARLMFDHLGSYSDSKSRYTYYGIRADEVKLAGSKDETVVSSVAARYTQMGAYLDCEKRAAAMEAKVLTILDDKYDAAVALKKEGKYCEAITAFKAIQRHKDSKSQIEECETAILDGKYDAAVALRNDSKFDEAIAAFTPIKEYKDSAEQIKACEMAIMDIQYVAAMELKADGKYNEAIAAFETIRSHKDSAEQIKSCETIILDRKYDAAMMLKNAGKYEEAIIAFKAIRSHKDSAEQINMCETIILDGRYDAAVKLLADGKYREAYDAFSTLTDYKDSKEIACNIYLERINPSLKTARVGSVITFGNYEQDNNSTNGKEPIKWRVLAKENDRLLVISQDALDSQYYHNPGYYTLNASATWKTCTLRNWLNYSFIYAAFSEVEMTLIPTVTLSNNADGSTEDRVFLLSASEAVRYFSSDDDRECKATAYAKEQGAYVKLGQCWWRLRSSGTRAGGVEQKYAARVDQYGRIDYEGIAVDNDACAIRPALWIEIPQ